MFAILLTNEAKKTLARLRNDASQSARYKAVAKAIRFLSENPDHPSLNTHSFHSLHGPEGAAVYESYAQQNTPGAYRVMWYYGPARSEITILVITPHPR